MVESYISPATRQRINDLKTSDPKAYIHIAQKHPGVEQAVRTNTGGGSSAQTAQTEQTVTPVPQTATETKSRVLTPVDTTGQKITAATPGTESYVSPISPTQYPTAQKQEPYSRWWAVKESFRRAVNNRDMLGNFEFRRYASTVFVDPFKLSGTRQADKTVGTGGNKQTIELAKEGGLYFDTRTMRDRGTTMGMGTGDLSYGNEKPYINATYYDVQAAATKAAYEKAGTKYTGEPIEVLPTRAGEQVQRDIRPVYTDKLNAGLTEGQNIYQEKVNRDVAAKQIEYQRKIDTGEMSYNQATKEFNTYQTTRLATASTNFNAYQTELTRNINEQYKNEYQKTYSSRMEGVGTKIGAITDFRNKIFTSSDVKFIKTTGNIVESGAILGATAFGSGTLVTAAVVPYMSTKLASRAVDTRAASPYMTTGQKIKAGAGLSLGAAAIGLTANIGINRFYSEWRSIKYADLYAQKATTKGALLYRDDEAATYIVSQTKKIGAERAVTRSLVDVYKTGENRVGFYQTGITKTRIYDPQYEKFVFRQQSFKAQGFIPNMQTDIPLFTATGSGGYISAESASTLGLGTTSYIPRRYTPGFYEKALGLRAKPVTQSGFYGATQTTEGGYYVKTGGAGTSIQKLKEGGVILKDYSASGFISEGNVLPTITTTGSPSPVSFDFIPTKFYKTMPTTELVSRTGYGTIVETYPSVSSGFSASTGATTAAQQIGIANIGIGAAKTRASTLLLAPIVAGGFKLGVVSAGGLDNNVSLDLERRGLSLPTGSQLGIGNVAVVGLDRAIVGTSGSGVVEGEAQIVQELQVTGLTNIGGSGFGDLSPGGESGFLEGFGGGFAFLPLGNFAGLKLPSNIVKGGRKVVRYTPSPSALLFKIKGVKPKGSETGVGFRPITKGFKFVKKRVL